MVGTWGTTVLRASEAGPADESPEEGAVSIRVGSLPEGFFVEDDGPGIPPEEREPVFETEHSSTDEGTGFGLSIVNRVAEAHGWTVAVTDGETGGARFEFTDVEFGRRR